jgi:hypothetical protein
VAATLGLSDLLADHPLTSAELAVATQSHERTLERLLRVLVGVGVYEELPDGRYRSTDVGAGLRSDVPGSLRPWASYVGRPPYWQAWSSLLHSVRTGENAFTAVHGQSVWEYRLEHPEDGVAFDASMTALSAAVAESVVSAYDFDRFTSVVDVGGGQGALLATILRHHTSLRGTVFDQPVVVAGAPELLAQAGVGARCTVVGGSFFDEVPAGQDCYLLKSVVHDWDDARALDILRTCRRAMTGDATLLLVERLLTSGASGLDVALQDLNMLVAPGGQERTEDEYAALLDAAGLRLTRTIPTTSGVSLIEATPHPATGASA